MKRDCKRQKRAQRNSKFRNFTYLNSKTFSNPIYLTPTPRRNFMKSYFSIALIIIIVVAVMWLYYFDPAKDEVFIKCPFKSITGWDCPGCGSQRAIHELLHFNFKSAFHYNPLLVTLIPYVALGFIFQNKNVNNRFPKVKKFLFGKNAIIIVLMIIFLFFILRNM